MNAGPKESLGVPNAMDSATEPASKFNDVLGRTVGQSTVGFRPYELVRVKLRGIGREPMHVEPLVSAQKLLDDEIGRASCRERV